MLFIITILIIILSLVNGFKILNKRLLNKRDCSLFQQENIINDIIKEQNIYTVIWKRNRTIEILLEDLKKNKMSVVFIDEIIYADDGSTFKYSDEPMILENDYYIGGFFEIYEKIFQKL